MFSKDNLHHAYLIEGSKILIIPELHNTLERELSFVIQANPDYWYGEFDSIGVDDARALAVMQQKRSTMGGKKIFVITFNNITREAQNALLKVLEEPTEDTHFFMITHSVATLLPTLKSRMLIRTHGSVGEVNEKENKLARKFLSATPAERIKQIKKIIDSDTAKVDAFKFISELEQVIDEAVKQGNTTSESFGEIYTVKSYLSDTSPAVKMLLEHLSCTLPLIK